MSARSGFTQLNVARTEEKQPVEGLRFDWIMVALSLWFVSGLFIDGWAHSHGKTDNTFFTPWHAVFYSGFVAVAIGLLSALFINRARGRSWLQAIPAGYELSILGLVIFGVSGVGDMIWHILFGIEASIEALLSPTHLGLAVGMALVVSGPFRAAWYRVDETAGDGWTILFPMLLSLTFTLSLLTFFTEFANPIATPYAMLQSSVRRTQNMLVGLGVDSFLLYTGLLMGAVFWALRRWQLPVGAITLVFTVNALLMCAFSELFFLLPALVLAGIAADILLKVLRPSQERPGAFRLFAFLVPFILYLLYFLALMIVVTERGHSFTWSIHLWMGSAVMAGIAGLLLSLLSVSPASPMRKKHL